LTQDFSLLGLSEARLAALCTAKGRMLASFVGFKLAADDILLLCPLNVLPATLKRLSMFVMRAQCKLTDATEAFDLIGLTGSSADALAIHLNLGPAPWAKATWAAEAEPTTPATSSTSAAPRASTASATVVRLPAAGQAPQAVTRLLACLPAGQALPVANTIPALSPDAWAWLEVQSGVAMVSQPVVEAFVPQMLNYESVGGVNFKKGCYPGQEVVARSQYRGILKRRAYRVEAAAGAETLTVGQDVFHSRDAEQPCGTVVAVANWGGQQEALVSMQTSATEGGSLHAGSANGPTLSLQTLPYELLADI
jgi:hypothetical protein